MTRLLLALLLLPVVLFAIALQTIIYLIALAVAGLVWAMEGAGQLLWRQSRNG